MARKRRDEGRAPNGAGSIYYSEADGKWHGRITVGVRDDGRPDRRHVKRKTEGEVVDALQELEQQRRAGTVRKPGKPWTVEAWLKHWVENIAAPSIRYKALEGYRTAVYRHLIPGIGAHRLDKIRPEHFEKLYTKLTKSGLKPATAHQVHRTARTALGEAEKRGHLGRNPVSLAKPPRIEEEEIEPIDSDDVKRILRAALHRRNGVRFVIALALGCRQGEALGLKWDNLNEQNRTLRIRKALQRQKWQHGCTDPHTCGAKYHKTEPCKDGCKQHTRPCPPPCPPDCTEHARNCPQRHGGGLVEVDVKSRAGRRLIGLPDQLFELLQRHRDQQEAERQHAGSEWHDSGRIFTQPNGKALDPRRDYAEWHALLAEAGVAEARLHDARHTAATVLLILGVPDRTVMEVMGWSSVTMK
ncbi:tyrosine-type recombinase/integrase, partial [Haloactinomyces albus]